MPRSLLPLLTATVFVMVLVCGCSERSGHDGEGRLRLATTTSTDNSGLLRHLLPRFEERYDCEVDVIAVGTGKALILGKNGDVDVLLVHAPAKEKEFVERGFGVDRRGVMYSYFVIVGPGDDPAGISGMKDAAAAFERIAAARALFCSRGDNSGTHIKEVELWSATDVSPQGQSWYMEAGLGMGNTLTMASEQRAYCLTDRGTHIAFESNGRIDLPILVEGDLKLYNPYSIIAVNPE
ncbi:MAG: substrate-binding domain-containing protein, partial [Candidatus Brocadiia bacterium]|nr:substrate-binding domain-containing protein [Candidatus Brocadiia bacterium]